MPYRRLLSTLTLLSLSLSFTFLFSLPSLAQEPDQTPSVSEETIKENIRERLEEAVKGTAADTTSPNSTPVKRAWAGNLTDITNHTLTIESNSQAKQVEVSDTTVIVNANRETIAADNLEIDTFLIAMGYLTAGGVLDARRIVESSPPKPLTLAAYFVTVGSIDDDTITVKDKENTSWELSLSDDTVITQSVAGAATQIDVDNLKVGDELVLIGEENEATPTTLDTTNIHLLSSRVIPSIDTNESSPSSKAE